MSPSHMGTIIILNVPCPLTVNIQAKQNELLVSLYLTLIFIQSINLMFSWKQRFTTKLFLWSRVW